MTAALLLFLMSCTKIKKTDSTIKDNHCMPGYVFINYIGITDKIKKFTLIRISENDTSYMYSYRTDIPSFSNDSLFFRIYCNNYIADKDLLVQLKKYTISHNTHKKVELSNIDNYEAVKIAYVDLCDTIEYVINNGDTGYFSNMIDTLKIKDESLIKYLSYYENIISIPGR